MRERRRSGGNQYRRPLNTEDNESLAAPCDNVKFWQTDPNHISHFVNKIMAGVRPMPPEQVEELAETFS